DSPLTSPKRLEIVAFLIGCGGAATYVETLRAIGVPHAANLGTHLRVLERKGFVAIRRQFVDRKPRTTLTITDAGRQEFSEFHARVVTLAGMSASLHMRRAKRRRGNTASRVVGIATGSQARSISSLATRCAASGDPRRRSKFVP